MGTTSSKGAEPKDCDPVPCLPESKEHPYSPLGGSEDTHSNGNKRSHGDESTSPTTKRHCHSNASENLRDRSHPGIDKHCHKNHVNIVRRASHQPVNKSSRVLVATNKTESINRFNSAQYYIKNVSPNRENASKKGSIEYQDSRKESALTVLKVTEALPDVPLTERYSEDMEFNHDSGRKSLSPDSKSFWNKVPTGPRQKMLPLISQPPIQRSQRDQTYIFIPSESIPVLETTVYHLRNWLKQDDIRFDASGYYIFFYGVSARANAQNCFSQFNGTICFNHYKLTMHLHLGHSGLYPEPLMHTTLPSINSTTHTYSQGALGKHSSSHSILQELPPMNEDNARAQYQATQLNWHINLPNQDRPLLAEIRSPISHSPYAAAVSNIPHDPLITPSNQLSHGTKTHDYEKFGKGQQLLQGFPHLLKTPSILSEILPGSPSDTKSLNSRSKDEQCQSCKSTHSSTFNPLIGCVSCGRNYHQACHTMPKEPRQDVWKCYSCMNNVEAHTQLISHNNVHVQGADRMPLIAPVLGQDIHENRKLQTSLQSSLQRNQMTDNFLESENASLPIFQARLHEPKSEIAVHKSQLHEVPHTGNKVSQYANEFSPNSYSSDLWPQKNDPGIPHIHNSQQPERHKHDALPSIFSEWSKASNDGKDYTATTPTQAHEINKSLNHIFDRSEIQAVNKEDDVYALQSISPSSNSPTEKVAIRNEGPKSTSSLINECTTCSKKLFSPTSKRIICVDCKAKAQGNNEDQYSTQANSYSVGPIHTSSTVLSETIEEQKSPSNSASVEVKKLHNSTLDSSKDPNQFLGFQMARPKITTRVKKTTRNPALSFSEKALSPSQKENKQGPSGLARQPTSTDDQTEKCQESKNALSEDSTIVVMQEENRKDKSWDSSSALRTTRDLNGAAAKLTRTDVPRPSENSNIASHSSLSIAVNRSVNHDTKVASSLVQHAEEVTMNRTPSNKRKQPSSDSVADGIFPSPNSTRRGSSASIISKPGDGRLLMKISFRPGCNFSWDVDKPRLAKRAKSFQGDAIHPVNQDQHPSSESVQEDASNVSFSYEKRVRPDFSYAKLIGMSLLSTPDAPNGRMEALQICKWVVDTIQGYSLSDRSFVSGISAVLSQKKDHFMKIPRPPNDPGKRFYWGFVPGAEHHYLKYQPPEISDLLSEGPQKDASINTSETVDSLIVVGNPPSGIVSPVSPSLNPKSWTWESSGDSEYELKLSPTEPPDPGFPLFATKIHLNDRSYAVSDLIHLTSQGQLEKVLGRVEAIELNHNGEYFFQVSWWMTKDLAESLKCSGLERWPSGIKYVRLDSNGLDRIPGLGVEDINIEKPGPPSLYHEICHIYHENGQYNLRVDFQSSSASEFDSSEKVAPQDIDLDISMDVAEDTRNEKDLILPDIDKPTIHTVEPCRTDTPLGWSLEGLSGELHSIAPVPKLLHKSKEQSVLDFLNAELDKKEISERDLFDACPHLHPDRVLWDKDAKIKEIKKRPSRKTNFACLLANSGRERLEPHVEINRPRRSCYSRGIALPPKRASRSALQSPKKPNPHDENVSEDTSATEVQKHRTIQYDSLDDLLGLPDNPVPILYENQLAFREGVPPGFGRVLPRAKNVYKVGRNVVGQLK